MISDDSHFPGLEYCSQRLESLPHQRQHDRPLCLFCEEFRTNRLLCEKEMVLSSKVTRHQIHNV